MKRYYQNNVGFSLPHMLACTGQVLLLLVGSYQWDV